MKRYLEYNNSSGEIYGIRNISETDISLYTSELVSLSNIGEFEIDIRNSFFDISASEIKELPSLGIEYTTLNYEISSLYGISLSSIPLSSTFILEYEHDIIEEEIVEDGIITFTTDTPGVYTFEFDNLLYNNLSSTTFSITAT